MDAVAQPPPSHTSPATAVEPRQCREEGSTGAAPAQQRRTPLPPLSNPLFADTLMACRCACGLCVGVVLVCCAV